MQSYFGWTSVVISVVWLVGLVFVSRKHSQTNVQQWKYSIFGVNTLFGTVFVVWVLPIFKYESEKELVYYYYGGATATRNTFGKLVYNRVRKKTSHSLTHMHKHRTTSEKCEFVCGIFFFVHVPLTVCYFFWFRFVFIWFIYFNNPMSTNEQDIKYISWFCALFSSSLHSLSRTVCTLYAVCSIFRSMLYRIFFFN